MSSLAYACDEILSKKSLENTWKSKFPVKLAVFPGKSSLLVQGVPNHIRLCIALYRDFREQSKILKRINHLKNL